MPSNENLREHYYTRGELRDLSHKIRQWREAKGFATHWENVPEKLMLIVTELSEAMEAYRHLPSGAIGALRYGGGKVRAALGDSDVSEWSDWYNNFKEELADTAIRLLDLAASLDIDIEAEIADKMVKNHARPKKHGKER